MSTDRYARIRGILDPEHLGSKRVGVIGAGSAGAPIVSFLANDGVGVDGRIGRWYLWDADIVEESNCGTVCLNAYESPHDLGLPKVEVLANHISNRAGKTVNIIGIQRRVELEDVDEIRRIAEHLDLLILTADDFVVTSKLAEVCWSICPIVTLHFGLECREAEIGFSVPGQTLPLNRVFRGETFRRIDNARALPSHTIQAVCFAVEICEQILSSATIQVELLPGLFSEASLFIMGFHKRGIFQTLPEEQIRSVIRVITNRA